MLIDTIKSDLLLARKLNNQVEKNLLTTLVGDAERVGKDKGNRPPNDDEVQAVVKKFMKGVDENIKLKDLPIFQEEKSILARYLPKMLSKESLANIIDDLVAKHNNRGLVMKELAACYKNMYDGKVVAGMIDSALNK